MEREEVRIASKRVVEYFVISALMCDTVVFLLYLTAMTFFLLLPSGGFWRVEATRQARSHIDAIQRSALPINSVLIEPGGYPEARNQVSLPKLCTMVRSTSGV